MKYLVLFISFMAFILTGCNDNDSSYKKATGYHYYALYGDYASTTVFKIDIPSMKVEAEIDVSPAKGPYGVEVTSENEAFALTRAGESIAIINYKSNKVSEVIPLDFKPRSVATRKKSKVVIVSGKSKPMAVAIGKHNHKVIRYFGENTTQPVDKANYFGGGNATGHPFLLKDCKRFLLLDRVNRKISLYSIDSEVPLSEIQTETTAHHIIKIESTTDDNGNGLYYAVLEGPKDPFDLNIPAASIIQFRVTDQNTTEIVRTVHIKHVDGGTHHADCYEDKYIFLPAFNRKTYIIDKDSLQIKATFQSGLGGGHTTFSYPRKVAIITNHKDAFLTEVDISDPIHPKVIRSIPVAPYLTQDELKQGKNTQSHTATFDPTGRFFYSVANTVPRFYEVDLDYGWVSRHVDLNGSYVPMGDFVAY